MSEEWYTSGLDGEFVSNGKNKNRQRKRTKIPNFRSVVKKSTTRRRKRRVHAEHDSETLILMWVVITLLVSAIFHAEWLFISLYVIFILYTLLTKDIKPINYVSSIIMGIGIIFFIATTLVVLFGFLGETNMLQDPITQKAYKYIIGTPLMSCLIVRLLEKFIEGFSKKKTRLVNIKSSKRL
ncbi:hypothetical protein [Planomicrobium okeanokoites]|uniref:hypothetical protein n=1 Tax=Planomicrobium okeanokoites TaxID=244 RepID=UPI000A006883|nr:hypothetical protein [Planomicrobium okeanokoites]